MATSSLTKTMNRRSKMASSIKHLDQVFYWTERLKKNVKLMATIWYQLFLSNKISFHDVGLKNYLLPYAESACHEIRPLVLNRIAK